MKKILCLVVVLLLVAFAYAESASKDSGFVPWAEYGIAQRIPDISACLGKEFEKIGPYSNEDNSFRDSVDGLTPEDFRKYTDVLVSVGFNIDVHKIGDNFMATSFDKIDVTASLRNGVMAIDAFGMSVFDK